jgi:hypothetical protein
MMMPVALAPSLEGGMSNLTGRIAVPAQVHKTVACRRHEPPPATIDSVLSLSYDYGNPVALRMP